MYRRLRQLTDRVQSAIVHAERESVTGQIEDLSENDGRPHWDVVGVTLVACVVLTFLEFYGSSTHWDWLANLGALFGERWEEGVKNFFRDDTYGRLRRLAYWSSCTIVGYMLIPMIWVKLVMRRSLRGMGLSTQGFLTHAWIYALLFLVVLPVVYLVSGTESFQSTYPFYGKAGRSAYDFIIWELFYGLQFLSLEFFFRGFLIHGLKRRFGFYAIFVSVIPYCMIHFGKPFPEALGSIVAGLTLGAFSLFTGSIWLGVAIHISVAVSMDIFALM